MLRVQPKNSELTCLIQHCYVTPRPISTLNNKEMVSIHRNPDSAISHFLNEFQELLSCICSKN